MIPQIPNPIDKLKDQANQIAESWLLDLAGDAGQSAQLFLEKAATFWVTGIKSPQLTYATEQNPYTPASTIAYLWSHLHWYVSALAVLSIFIAAGKMAIQRNSAPARELLQSILTLIVVSSAGIATISLLTSASDEAASYILKGAMTDPSGDPTNFQKAFGLMFVVPTPTKPTAFLLLILMVVVLIGAVVQVALLIVRGGMLFLLAGTLPLMAAATNTETGRAWFKKGIAWTIAFLLYKPVAAIVYATAFMLTREGTSGAPSGALAPSSGDQLIKVVTGMVLMFLAIFALPALLRFTVPAVNAAAGGSGGGGVAALSGAMAMGAKTVFSGRGGGGGGGGGGRGKSDGGKSAATGGPAGNTTPGGPVGNTTPGGGKSAAGMGAGKAASVKAAGPVGAVASGVAEGLKKVTEGANSAVSNAAGENGPDSAPRKTPPPTKGKGKSPSGGATPKNTPPGKTQQQPPSGPTGGTPGGKTTGQNKPPTTEGPTGGKR